MLTKNDVTAAYRLILGRMPENDEAINVQIKGNHSIESLRDNLLTSPEFLVKVKTDVGIRRALQPATMIINSLPASSRSDGNAGRGRKSIFNLWSN